MQTQTQHKFGRYEVQSLISLAVTLVIMGAALFVPAGTVVWTRGWVFLGVYVGLILIAMAWIWRTNPELFAARRKFQKGTKSWDAVVASLSVVCYVVILPVAALDDARFHWAPQPDWVVWLGYALMTLGVLGFTWAQGVNRHFEATVRIQTDRDHKVIDTGPYAFIRHPGYIFGSVMAAGIALALGSLWALIPVAALAVLLIGRTLGEEAVLREGLPGYVDYTKRVRFRWIPGVW